MDQNRNDKYSQSNADHLFSYGATTNGAYRLLQVGNKGLKTVGEAGARLPARAVTLQRNLGIGTASLGLIRLPFATSEGIKSLSDLTQTNEVPFYRKAIKAVRDTMDAIASWGYAAAFIGFNPVIATIAQTFELHSDLADLKISYDDYSKSTSLAADAKDDVKEALLHSKNYNFYRILKAVASLASVILGFTILLTGFQLVSVCALVTLSLLTTLLAIKRDWMKDTGRYKVITFDKPVEI